MFKVCLKVAADPVMALGWKNVFFAVLHCLFVLHCCFVTVIMRDVDFHDKLQNQILKSKSNLAVAGKSSASSLLLKLARLCFCKSQMNQQKVRSVLLLFIPL